MENNMKESSGSSTSTSLSTNSSPPRYSENLPMPRHARLPLEHDESDKEEEEEEEALAAGGVVSGAFCHCRKRNLLNATKMEKQRQNEEIANEAELSLSLTAKGACFIDASSLLDEDELLNVNRQTTTTTATAIATTTTTTTTAINQSNSSSSCNSEPDGAGAAMLPKDATNNTATATTTTTTTNSSNINNLSDEEKLWKRHQHKQTADDDTEASISLAAYASDISERSENILIKYQQPAQQQHQQQSAAAHKTITYTTLPLSMSPKFNAFHTTTTTTTIGDNELCYTTDYSSSSPAASLVWSKQDKRTLQQQPPITTAANTLINNYKHEFNLMPDTPHNSIVNIEHNTNNNSNTSSIHRDCSTLSSSLSQQRDSGAFCMDSPISLPSTPKPAYRQQQQQQQQQHQHQKQQMLAEKSASQMEDDAEVAAVELRRYVKPAAQPVALSASWVVDMSDCRSSNSSFSDLSLPATKQRDRERDRERERCDSGSSIRSNRSCGFYVPLSIKADQVESLETTTPQPQSQQNTTKNLHLNTKSYTGPAKTKAKSFFINLSQSDTQVIDKQAESVEKQQQQQQQQQTESNERYDKKSIFSLFIDIGGEKKREFPAQLAQRLIGSKRYMTTAGGGNVAGNNATEQQQQHQQHQQQPQYEQQQQQQQNKSSNSSTETLMSKSANFKKQQQQQQQHSNNNNNNNETIINRRRHVNDNNSSKRHSWNEHNDRQTTDEGNNQYKRSISLTNTSGDKDGLMSIIDKIAIISKTTQQQQQQQHGGVIDNSSCTESATNSHTNLSLSSSVEQQQQQQQQRQKIRQRDVAINQTYDVCSLASITDSLLSKDPSPISTADTDDLTFQQDEELATLDQQTDTIYDAGNNRMATILETKETPTKQQKQQQHQSCNLLDELAMEPAETDNLTRHTMETLHATIEKQKMLLETVNEHAEVICGRSAFVKLSDLDKPVDEVFLKCTTNEQQQQQRAFNRSNIGRPHSWTHSMTRSSGCSAAHSLLNITSSMENLRSLTRLFPHFSKEISNSLPNDVTLHHLEYAPTDASGDSSMASSFSRSGMDESSISCRQPRRLGEDLLKMFLQEIATDMIVEVHGRRIRAHKCILRSRCQYFAAVLAGNEHQSIVSLQGYSHSAVHFALCHIYSGASHPPDGVSLMELAALADLMGLEGLKEVTAHALKINYCHNFHKPCAGCIDGILQVLPVALNHALDDLYRKCLRWTCRYYLKVWATRQFCQLPTDILARCRQQIIAYLSSETVLDTLLECETLLLHMANCSWGGVCESLARDIIDACHSFIAGHFASLVASDAFLSLGNDHSEHIPQLEDVLLRIASTLNAEQACRSYQRVTRLNTVLEGNALHLHANLSALAKELQGLQDEDLDWNPEFIRLVSAIMSAVEQCLVRQCSRAMRVTAWQRMDLNLRKKIQTLAHLTDPIELKRGRALPKSSYTVGGGSRNQDLYQVKLAIQAHSRRSNPHDIYNMPTIGNHTHTQTIVPPKTIERGVQATTMEPKNAAKGKILKSNSRSYVPQPVRNNAYKNQKNNNLNINNNNHFNNNNNNNLNNNHINETNHTYRRTQSTENPSKKLVQQRVAALESSSESLAKPLKKLATQTVKLSEVRPRYLEPRKLHTQRSEGPVRSATSSSIPSGSAKIKVPQMSSSQSSRHSSPAASKKSQTKPTRNGTSVGVVGGTHSARRSYDSLTTPPMRGKSNNSSITSKLSDNDHYSEAGSVNTTADSQATNTTVSSHKSFKEMGKFSRSNPLMGKKDMLEKRRQPLHLSQQQKQQQRLSTGSSPSSIATSKSATSRLSSVSSSQSTRDIYKQRSISMTTGQQQQQIQQQQQQQQRYSFLSAKSREILARRAEKNKLQAEQMKRMKELQQQQQKYVDDNVFIDDDDDDDDVNEVELRVPALRVHNNRLTTTKTTINSVPATRPNSLNLRKNNNSFSNNRQATTTTTTTTTTNNYNKHKLNKIDVDVEVEVEVPPSPSPSPPTTMNNSNTMERSNTFCKDSPALDINHMQIID